MVTVVDVVGLLVILGVNSAAAALLTRYFRVTLNTQWGSVLYSLLLVPVVLLVFVLVLGGVGLGPNLGDASTVVGVTILLPMALGMAFDYFWQPAPEEIELPESYS
ncbi:hypothetical protein [Halorarius halobius]|uniref:hypothetical protein n=1 Tax=Halorarius halobius TaxID=2962671 RepID=UPI0020CC5ACD|nr:hypothetical protein [Halorarius halobius]